ncbi:MAG: aminotransferase class IV, partial [Myxococcota bacterium]|nr:aminotransferase class IV [Myxococcota bacterium]
KKAGYTEVLYLDAKEKLYIDESGPANFFGITRDGRYVTPHSESILPSITNKSLVTLAEELGMRPERRRVAVEEIFDFQDAGCCGTAAVITPVGSITYGERKVVYAKEGKAGPFSSKLYERLTGIQVGHHPDTYGWLSPIHPGRLRCSSVKYQEYSPFSRLAERATRRRNSGKYFCGGR